MAVGRFDMREEGVVAGHVAEGGGRRGVERPVLGQYDYLAQLGAGDVRAWSELQAARAAGIPTDDALVVSGFYVLVEGVVGWHVLECGCDWGVDSKALGQYHNLG